MFETLKKSLLTGVGLALRSKKEIEELARDFAKSSQMNQDEAKAFLTECQEKYEEARLNFDQKMEAAVEKVLEKLDLPTRSDIRQLNERIDRISEKLSEKE